MSATMSQLRGFGSGLRERGNQMRVRSATLRTHGRRPSSPRVRTLAVIGLGVTALVLAGCGSGSGTSGSGDPNVSALAKTTPQAPPVAMAIEPAGPAPINPTTPVRVTASGGKLTNVTMTNTEKGNKVAGELAPDGASWRSTEPLGYGAHYNVVADGTNVAGQPTETSFPVAVMAPPTAYANLIPAPEVVQQTGVGVGQPIVFQFTKNVAASQRAEVEKHLSITSDPPQPGAWYWTDSKNVHYRPAEYWQPGTTITVKANVYGVDLGNGVFGAEDNSATYHVHDAWIARADGRSEQLQIFHNGALVNSMPMSLGSPGHPSHVGPHVISDKQPSIIMDSCSYGVCQGQPGYYREKVDLDERISNDGEFVHSAPWSVGSQGDANVSHGCVNLSPANAQWFYDHFGLGDVVEVTNSGGPPLPVWDLYGDWEVPWPTWQAGNANG